MSDMRLLRTDLHFTPMPDGAGCQVHDERSGKVFEFGAIEQFLLERFIRPYEIEQVCADCNGAFGLNYTSSDILDFLALLSDWGLLQDANGGYDAKRNVATKAVDEVDSPASVEQSKNFQQPNRWHLFNPEAALDSLCRTLSPLRFMVWLIPLFFALGLVVVMFNPNAFLTGLGAASSHFSLFGRLALAAVTANLLSQVARGMLARQHGLATPSFGILMLFGLIPRFNVQIVPTVRLERQTRLWLAATSTLVRLGLFGAGILLWSVTRASGSSLAMIGVELAVLSLVSLVFIANPLWRGDGSIFLSALLDIPDVQRRSRSALMGVFFKQPAAIVRHSRNGLVLGMLGFASLIFFLLVVGFVIYKIFTYLETHYQGAGVALFLVLGGYVSLSIRRQINAREMRSESLRGGEARGGQTSVPSLRAGAAALSKSAHEGRTRSWSKYILLAIALICLFLPYRYETSGLAEVLPSARVSVTPEMDGMIEEIFFNGGEWVKAGTTLARIADYRQINEMRLLEAEITAKKHEIEKYRTTPSQEEIRLAEQRVATSRVQSQYSQEKLQRQKPLFAAGFISSQVLDDARNAAARDSQLLAESEASLKSLKAQINPNQIGELSAELEKLQREVDYYREQLRRTNLKTPIEGRIISKDLLFQRNMYLEAGKLFAEVEDTRTVLLRIAVPEFDIGEVVVGAPLSFRLWAYPERKFLGTVTEIQPVTEEADYGKIVYVTSRLNNPDGALVSGLTGQAKVVGKRTIALLAFTKALVRFVSVEVWSWLP